MQFIDNRIPSPRSMVLGLRDDVSTAVDVGCGFKSVISELRPAIKTMGLDNDSVISSAKNGYGHDLWLPCDVSHIPTKQIIELFGGRKPDLVTAIGVIEHLKKSDGYLFLDALENLTSKFVLLETPNGFIEQGPEFGNENQRHLSGWFPNDFEGRGYKVFGSTGLKCLHGYAGCYRFNLPLMGKISGVMSLISNLGKHPNISFNLLAFKDVRGTKPKL